ncbi:MAG: hypothetical protein WCG83_00470 [Candidatus Peregrinibacteria bacterium]
MHDAIQDVLDGFSTETSGEIAARIQTNWSAGGNVERYSREAAQLINSMTENFTILQGLLTESTSASPQKIFEVSNRLLVAGSTLWDIVQSHALSDKLSEESFYLGQELSCKLDKQEARFAVANALGIQAMSLDIRLRKLGENLWNYSRFNAQKRQELENDS